MDINFTKRQITLSEFDIQCIIPSDEFGPYPVTVIADRYNGCYSGAAFTAWPLIYTNMPLGPDADDVNCGAFWNEADKRLIGLGATPQEAFDDLTKKAREYPDKTWLLKDFG